MDSETFLLICFGIMFLLTLLSMYIFTRSIHKVGPDQALIIYGRGGVKVITGGSYFVPWTVQRAQYLSLALMSFEIPTTLNFYPIPESTTNVLAVALVKVRSDNQNILTAAELFLSTTPQERERMISLAVESHLHEKQLPQEPEHPVRLVLAGTLYEPEREHPVHLVVEGNLESIIGNLNSVKPVRNLETIGSQMLKSITPDLEKMGLEMISFTLKEIRTT